MRVIKIITDYLDVNGTATEAVLNTELQNNGHGELKATSVILDRLVTNGKLIKTVDDYSLPV